MAQPPGTTSLHYVHELVRNSKNQAASEIGRRTLVRKLKSRLNRHLRLDPGSSDQGLTASDLRDQLEDCRSKIDAEFSRAIEGNSLEHELERQEIETVKIQEQESTPDTLPGREVLKKIAERATPNGNYETLRNAILNEMARADFQPPGMKAVLDRCLSSATSRQ